MRPGYLNMNILQNCNLADDSDIISTIGRCSMRFRQPLEFVPKLGGPVLYLGIPNTHCQDSPKVPTLTVGQPSRYRISPTEKSLKTSSNLKGHLSLRSVPFSSTRMESYRNFNTKNQYRSNLEKTPKLNFVTLLNWLCILIILSTTSNFF